MRRRRSAAERIATTQQTMSPGAGGGRSRIVAPEPRPLPKPGTLQVDQTERQFFQWADLTGADYGVQNITAPWYPRYPHTTMTVRVSAVDVDDGNLEVAVGVVNPTGFVDEFHVDMTIASGTPIFAQETFTISVEPSDEENDGWLQVWLTYHGAPGDFPANLGRVGVEVILS